MASKVQLTGGLFQDSEGNVLAGGYLTFKLSQDCVVNTSQVCAGIKVTVTLDGYGSIVGGQYIWGNDQMSPVNSYYIVTGYNSNGQIAWGPNNQQVTGSGGTFDVGTWVPNQVISWVPSVQGLALEVNGAANSSQSLLNLVNSPSVTFTDNGAGAVTAAASGGASFATTGQGGFWSSGFDLDSPIYAGSIGNITISTTNDQVTVWQFTLDATWTVKHISCNLTIKAGVGLKLSFGIYDSTGSGATFGAKLVEAIFDGSTATGIQTVTITPVVLTPGVYYFAQSAGYTSMQTTGCSALSTSLVDLMNSSVSTIRTSAQSPNPTSSGTMPAHLGVLTNPSSGGLYFGQGLVLFEP
jgi:hypothetical protein